MIDVGAQLATSVDFFYGVRAMRMLLETKEQGPGAWEIDEQAYPVVLQLNRIPGIATTWCCQGHPEFRDGEWHPGSKMYYAMAGGSNSNFLRQFHHALFRHLYQVFEVDHGLKGLDNPAWIVQYTENYLRCYEMGQWYPSVGLEARHGGPEHLTECNRQSAWLVDNHVDLPQLNYAKMANDLKIIDETIKASNQ